METFYLVLFGLLAVAAVLLELNKGRDKGGPTTKEFNLFKANYLTVYALMMGGDWLQGPYVYALYQHYGFDRGDIGRLFIAGFGSSMLIGTFVGALADKTGRKKAALTYVATYAFGCVTKHYNNFWILLTGRLFCGVATSLLYSAFESWLVAEHFKPCSISWTRSPQQRGFDAEWLGGTFRTAVFLGNGLMAILCGLLAHGLVETLQLGPVAPFDAAATVLLIGGCIILATWPENYGDPTERTSFSAQIMKAAQCIRNDKKIALLGAMQSLFEGAMYTFVFLWTPALSPQGEHIPHGFIFSTFMVSCMAGSALAGRLLSQGRVKPERYMQNVFAAASLALFVPVWFHFNQDGEGDSLNPEAPGISLDGKLQLVGFCMFEAMVGVFWPSMMKMRAEYVPEEMRATIINFFRIPLNLFVCIILYNVNSFPLAVMFGMCSAFLVVAAICQRYLEFLVSCEAKQEAKEKLVDQA